MRKINLFIVFALISSLLNACSGTPSASSQTNSLKVLATETFLGDIAQNVAGERVKVEILVPFGVDPHAFEPKPQDIARIEQSQALIVNGLGYEAWLKKTLDGIGGQRLEIVTTAGLTAHPDSSGEHPDG